MTWVQKETWHYWQGDKVVELRRSLIEYRPAETHQHFIVPYQRIGTHSIVALETDLREWDWIAERSKPVDRAERCRILEEMRQAVFAGGTTLTVVNRRPNHATPEALSSAQDVSDYLFYLTNILRDCGADDAADVTFYTAIGFHTGNPVTSEFLGNALVALRHTKSMQSKRLGDLERTRLQAVIEGVKGWLARG